MMGCDIHLHAEVKIDYDKILPGRTSGEGPPAPLRWEHYAHLHIMRNYDLFARMAGVRNYRGIEMMVEPRGLPEDISGVTLFDWMRARTDWHTPSWFNAKEIAQLSNWCETNLVAHPTLTTAPNGSHLSRHWDLEWETRSYLFGNSYAGFVQYPEERRPGLVDVRFIFWFDN
jgi:hypothetical protein